MSLYPTRQPITNAGIEAFLASLSPAPRAARINLRVKSFTGPAEAVIVDRMAEDMRQFGEGMTHRDLRRAGYTADQIRICAEKASIRALTLANLN